MPSGRSGRSITLGIVLLGIGVVVGVVATRRMPAVAQALAPLASSVAAWASSAPPSPSAPSTEPHPKPSVADDAAIAVHRQTAPLSSAQLGAPLVHGTFVGPCGAPDNMKVVVNVAVKMGHATKVSVTTLPPDPTVAACVERAVRDLQWDISPKTDHVTVTY
jgi:hypothetical protein